LREFVEYHQTALNERPAIGRWLDPLRAAVKEAHAERTFELGY
jgi:hypothetical protein